MGRPPFLTRHKDGRVFPTRKRYRFTYPNSNKLVTLPLANKYQALNSATIVLSEFDRRESRTDKVKLKQAIVGAMNRATALSNNPDLTERERKEAQESAEEYRLISNKMVLENISPQTNKEWITVVESNGSHVYSKEEADQMGIIITATKLPSGLTGYRVLDNGKVVAPATDSDYEKPGYLTSLTQAEQHKKFYPEAKKIVSELQKGSPHVTDEQVKHLHEVKAEYDKNEQKSIDDLRSHIITGKTTVATYNKQTDWLSITFNDIPTPEVRSQLKAQGFKYEPSTKRWKAKYTTEREDKLKALAGNVETIDIKTNWAKKAEHMAQQAQKHENKSQEASDKAHEIADRIPFGQPILVGHHSEKKHRSDINKIDNLHDKSVEEHKIAEGFQKRAERYGKLATGENPATIQNRIKHLEADNRKFKRELLGDIVEFEGKLYRRKGSQPSPERQDQLKRMIAHNDQRLQVEKQKYSASGGIPTENMNLKSGDRVKTSFGEATVQKVNKGTVVVKFDQQNLNFGDEGRKIGMKHVKAKI